MTMRHAARDGLALTVEHLTVRFGRMQVLHDVSFDVARGRTLAILGPNASGKTVLFRTLIGALPFTGTVTWADGTRIGYVPQKLDLERDVPMTGFDFLRARASLASHDVNLEQVLEQVDVPRAAARQRIGTLSGGQFQRLLVAFALVGDPTVLLLDEPTSGVDQPGQERLNELVRRLQDERGLTVLFISHELSVVFRYATDVLCLGRGRAWIGPPRTVLTPARLRDLYGAPVRYHVHAG